MKSTNHFGGRLVLFRYIIYDFNNRSQHYRIGNEVIECNHKAAPPMIDSSERFLYKQGVQSP